MDETELVRVEDRCGRSTQGVRAHVSTRNPGNVDGTDATTTRTPCRPNDGRVRNRSTVGEPLGKRGLRQTSSDGREWNGGANQESGVNNVTETNKQTTDRLLSIHL